MLALRIARAEPVRFPVAIFLMNDGMSMPVGQAWMQGASKQNRQRAASIMASCGVWRGAMSAMLAAAASGPSFGVIGIPDYLLNYKRNFAKINPARPIPTYSYA